MYVRRILTHNPFGKLRLIRVFRVTYNDTNFIQDRRDSPPDLTGVGGIGREKNYIFLLFSGPYFKG